MQLNLSEHMNCAVMTLNIFSTNNGFDACNTHTHENQLGCGLLLLFLILSQVFHTLDFQIWNKSTV